MVNLMTYEFYLSIESRGDQSSFGLQEMLPEAPAYRKGSGGGPHHACITHTCKSGSSVLFYLGLTEQPNSRGQGKFQGESFGLGLSLPLASKPEAPGPEKKSDPQLPQEPPGLLTQIRYSCAQLPLKYPSPGWPGSSPWDYGPFIFPFTASGVPIYVLQHEQT